MLVSWSAGAIVAASTLVLAGQAAPDKGASAQAQVVGEWALSRADNGPIGIVTQAATCADRIYPLASAKNTIYRIDIARPSLDVALGPDVLSTIARNPGELINLFVDCQAGLLSVVVDPLKLELPSFVATIDLAGRKVVRTFDLPLEFSPNSAGAIHYDPVARRAYLAGIWPTVRNGWMTKPMTKALTDATFGLILSLDNGSATKFLGGIEDDCRAWIGYCWNSFFAPLQPDEWVFAHGLGLQLAVIRGGKQVRMLEMRSPLFRYAPSDSVARNASRADGVAWAHRNSEIRRLFVVDGLIVAPHIHHTTEQANGGGWIDFTAYLNVFSRDGERVHSDLRLSGLPIGGSLNAVWVVSYRPERNNDATEMLLQRVSPRPAPAPRR